MASNFRYDVFIGYAKRDKQLMMALANRLRKDGLRLWFEGWDSNFDSEEEDEETNINAREDALFHSRTLLLGLSENVTALEWSSFQRHAAIFRDPAASDRKFIPLRLDNHPTHEIFRNYAHIDWRERSAKEYAVLLTACEKPNSRVESVQHSRVLAGHVGGVFCCDMSMDGRVAVSCSTDRLIGWDLEKENEYLFMQDLGRGSVSLSLAKGGTIVLAATSQKVIKVDLSTRKTVDLLEGLPSPIKTMVANSDGEKMLVGCKDGALFAVDKGAVTPFPKAHTEEVTAIAMSIDGQCAISASADKTLRIWRRNGPKKPFDVLRGHTDSVTTVAISNDGRWAVSGSQDSTLRLWDLAAAKCIGVLEAHTKGVTSVAIAAGEPIIVSGSMDHSVCVWDFNSQCAIAILKGHMGAVLGVNISADGRRIISASTDTSLRVWDFDKIYQKTSKYAKHAVATTYTNAKVVLVGETGVGKTGLGLRLGQNAWEPTESTHGMIVSNLHLPGQNVTHTRPTAKQNSKKGMMAQILPKPVSQREVWLWDFAGQPDYRLIHQLYMDETALGLLVFNPQNDNPFEELAHWIRALNSVGKQKPKKLLVAARCDRGGITISKSRFDQFCKEHGFAGFLTTSAKTGEGCEELKAEISRQIAWDMLPWTSTTRLFKSLKDALLTLQDAGSPLARLSELRQRLQILLPSEIISSDQVRAVVGLMQGQGVVRMLDFGDFVLFQPEYINRYASIVVRMAREHIDEMGCVSEQQVLSGQLKYHDFKRLGASDEKILLQAMLQTLLDRSLCYREHTPGGTMLVFPSYFRRDKPDLPSYPNVFVTYEFFGAIDEIYTTLVVRLSYSDVFKRCALWKNAADFETPEKRRVGLAMIKGNEGKAKIMVYFDAGVPDDTKITFVKYVHEHLLQRAESVTRVRTYVCPKCDCMIENINVIQMRLQKGCKDIICANCEARVPLLDLLEEKFSSTDSLKKVRDLDERARINLDNESRELILLGHAFAIAGEAGQIFRPTPNSDWGIDGEIEFKDYNGRASGARVYLQLKSGNSYLYQRQKDGSEVFRIKNPHHVDYWQKQPCPVMLVIRNANGSIRWMNISKYLLERNKRRKVLEQRLNKSQQERVAVEHARKSVQSRKSKKIDFQVKLAKELKKWDDEISGLKEQLKGPINEVLFDGEAFNAKNLESLRDQLLGRSSSVEKNHSFGGTRQRSVE